MSKSNLFWNNNCVLVGSLLKVKKKKIKPIQQNIPPQTYPVNYNSFTPKLDGKSIAN